MDPAEAFRQGLGSVNRARQARTPRVRESSHESEDPSPRIAHTLAACCRCRQRKTRCDPTLPRCIPCERAGAVCEYHDTAKGKKMSRTYVIRLQDKVRALEATLGQYTEEETSPPRPEDAIRPGGLVRLDENDDTPRFLGPSSGIAMTRLVMEEAKKYTDSRSIRELVPEVSQRRTPAQSPEAFTERKKSYPMISAVPAPTLPTRLVTDKLVEVFNQKGTYRKTSSVLEVSLGQADSEEAQYLFPTLHEPSFAKEVDEVYACDPDPYKNFTLRMVLAISMQKLDTQYAGLADSYYLAAMGHVEAVIRPKDLKTLQCLILIAQYSLLTPTRTALYYIIGLATKICQQMGLTEEKTIVSGVSMGLVDPLQLEMRRRLAWITLCMEFGLSHSLGRPNAFATGHDHIDIGFFETLEDANITSSGIIPGPPAEKKIMAIHFMKMRLLQAEIRRVLYQSKRPEPKSEEHPWYKEMERKLEDWLEAAPSSPSWSKSWFTRQYNTIVVFLYRPSPQVPKPTTRAATLCYDASAHNVRVQNSQIDNPSVDITWVFLQSLFMAINTLLWSISYPDVRSLHPKEEVEEVVEAAINLIRRCRDRWPGSADAVQLYSKLSKACLKSYTVSDSMNSSSSISANSPASFTDPASPISEHSSATTGSLAYPQKSMDAPPAFGYVFDQAPDSFAANEYHKTMPAPAPSFRSGSIFLSPASRTDRRFSYFPPEGSQQFDPSPPLQQQNPWGAMTMSPPDPPLHVTTTNPMINFNEPSYFMNAQYDFGPQFYDDTNFNMLDRQGSLSFAQQRELLESLEMDGLSGIDSYLNMDPAQYYNPSNS